MSISPLSDHNCLKSTIPISAIIRMTDKYKLTDPSPPHPSSPSGKPLASSHLTTSKLTGKSQSSSFQMMQELLKGATQAQQEEHVTSAEKESWGELLTNKYKMETYKAGLLS